MSKFSVAYAIVTSESADFGDFEESGMIDSGMCLRDAVKELFRTRTNAVGDISEIECSRTPQLVATVYNGMEFETGARENRSLHPESAITSASWRQIVRLIEGR